MLRFQHGSAAQPDGSTADSAAAVYGASEPLSPVHASEAPVHMHGAADASLQRHISAATSSTEGRRELSFLHRSTKSSVLYTRGTNLPLQLQPPLAAPVVAPAPSAPPANLRSRSLQRASRSGSGAKSSSRDPPEHAYAAAVGSSIVWSNQAYATPAIRVSLSLIHI